MSAYERKTIDIHISDTLRDILSEFETESEVASLLLKKRHHKEDLVECPVNFISVSEGDPTKISYLTEERILSLEKELPHTDFWTSSRRFQARPGAFISKIFKNISSKEVEKFSNLYRAQSTRPKFTFKIVNGESIRYYYFYDSYKDHCRGSLGNSCMKHDGCQKFLDIYVDNKDIITMLVMLDENDKLMGRALLWDFESHKIMDRIYTHSDEELQFYFKKWATDKGYLYKSEQNWYNTLNFESIGNKKREVKVDIKLPKMEYRYYPYIDTFKFYNTEKGTLHNYLPDAEYRRNVKILSASDGCKLEHDYLMFDDIDRVYKYRNEVINITYLDIWTHQSNAQWSDVNNQWILHKDSIYLEEIGDNIFNEEFERFNNRPVIDERIKLIQERRRKQKEKEEQMSRAVEQLRANGGGDIYHTISNVFRIGRTRTSSDISQTIESWASQQYDLISNEDQAVEPPTPQTTDNIEAEF